MSIRAATTMRTASGIHQLVIEASHALVPAVKSTNRNVPDESDKKGTTVANTSTGAEKNARSGPHGSAMYR